MKLNNILNNDNEFENLMLSIDKELKNKDIQISRREMAAMDYILENFQPHICLHDFISNKISNWYKKMYGEKLKMTFDIGSTLVDIDGDLYTVRLPLILGIVAFNPLELIQEVTPCLLNSLSRDKLPSIANHIMQHYKIYQNICPIKDKCASDLKTAIDKIIDGNYGLSRWGSLQAVEKSIKAYLSQKGKSFEKNHDINKILIDAQNLGLPLIEQSLIDKVQCKAGVRYNEEISTKKQAYEAYCAALQICNIIANNF